MRLFQKRVAPASQLCIAAIQMGRNLAVGMRVGHPNYISNGFFYTADVKIEIINVLSSSALSVGAMDTHPRAVTSVVEIIIELFLREIEKSISRRVYGAGFFCGYSLTGGGEELDRVRWHARTLIRVV